MEHIFSKKTLNILRDFSIITLGIFIVAAAVFFFLMPSNLSVGSAVGIAIVLSHFVPIPISVLTMALNAFFLLIGFLLIGREFGAKTVYCSVLMPVFIGIFEQLLPDYQSMMADPFLDMICYCLFVSIGMALLFTRNASSGGLDIVAKILNRYFHMDLGKAMSAAGICVALSSALAYDKKTVVLSLIGTYLNGIVLDNFIFGINTKKKVCIISEKMEEIRTFLINDLHSGATIYDTIGAYDFQPHKEIVTIVNKAEYAKLMSFISSTDKEAFMTVYTVNEIMYRPKVIPNASSKKHF